MRGVWASGNRQRRPGREAENGERSDTHDGRFPLVDVNKSQAAFHFILNVGVQVRRDDIRITMMLEIVVESVIVVVVVVVVVPAGIRG